MPAIPALIGAAGAVGGALISKKGAKDAAQAQADAMKGDPRKDAMLFGPEGTTGTGLLDQYKGMLDTPQSAASKGWADTQSDYLGKYGGGDMDAVRNASMGLLGGNASPMAQAAQAGPAAQVGTALTPAATMGAATTSVPAYAQGSMVNAPSQNGVDLKGSYDRFVNGTPGQNQFLDQSIDGAIAKNRLGFEQLQSDATKNLMQNVMPSIRSNSVISGQYGGSRQGIAEGNAIGTLGTEMSRAASMFGQNATNAAVGAKANAYETDSNRALSATQGLGAQQYGVAQQDAQTKNQAEFMNVGNQVNAANTNASLLQQSNMANLGTTMQANLANQNAANTAMQTNAGYNQQTNLTNAGFNQQTGLANQGAQLSTNAQNNSSAIAGGSMLGGLLNQAGGAVNAQDNYALNRAGQVNGLLAPYLNNNGVGAQPMYQNVAGQTMSGAMGGLALGNQLAGMFGGSSGSGATSLQTTGSAASMPTGWAPSQLPVQSFGPGW